MRDLLRLGSSVQQALETGQAVVALESTVIAHGLPYPTNLETARRMEEMTREIQSEFSSDRYVRGALTVRVPETLASVYMPAVVDRFHSEHPKVKLELINCSDEELREELNSGRIDLAFLLTDAFTLKAVNVKRLKTEELALVCSPAHPLAGQADRSLARLAGHTLLLPKTD